MQKGSDTFIAVDLGAGSGRVMAGTIEKNILSINVLHRFETKRIELGNKLFWDFSSIFAGIISGLQKAVALNMKPISIGVDSWGVDYALIDSCGELCGLPRSYRDNAFTGLAKRFFSQNNIDEYYASTGIDPMDINTMFQLWERHLCNDLKPSIAEHILFIPNLISYFLSGNPSTEISIASTSGLIDAASRKWNVSLIDKTGISGNLFQDVCEPGTIIGNITNEIARLTGIDNNMKVIAVCGHDTQSAVFSLPSIPDNLSRAFLISGTWSLLGAVVNNPILTSEARISGFSNECGADKTYNFLQNITGMWILQNLKSEWEKAGKLYDYVELTRLAELSTYNEAINPDDSIFHNPENMQQAIVDNLKKQNLSIPESEGDFVRCILRGLAKRYKKGISDLNTFLPHPVSRLDIVGGGAQNHLLNKFTSEECGIPVFAGETEASVVGNILMQALTLGIIPTKNSITEIKTL